MRENLITKLQDIVASEFGAIYTEIEKASKELEEVTTALNGMTDKLTSATQKKSQIETECDERLRLTIEREEASLEREAKTKAEELRVLSLGEAVQSEVETGRNTIKEIAKEIGRLDEQRREKEMAELAENDAEIKRLRAELATRLPELDKKEKDLKNKEDGLVVIEARWKKLFGDKGINFKV
jgi:DNA repair exonuclease SbcCD ATPase subunit